MFGIVTPKNEAEAMQHIKEIYDEKVQKLFRQIDTSVLTRANIKFELIKGFVSNFVHTNPALMLPKLNRELDSFMGILHEAFKLDEKEEKYVLKVEKDLKKISKEELKHDGMVAAAEKVNSFIDHFNALLDLLEKMLEKIKDVNSYVKTIKVLAAKHAAGENHEAEIEATLKKLVSAFTEITDMKEMSMRPLMTQTTLDMMGLVPIKRQLQAA